METKYICSEKRDGVLNIIHDRPPMNFLSIESMKEFIDVLRRAETDPEVKVITIRGGGEKFFSSGVDVADHTPERAEEMMEKFYNLLNAVMYGSKPKIAVVKGYALGGGCELIAFCDMVYASEKAKFGQPEINVGVYPGPAVAIFPKLIGLKKTYELILTGDMISAVEAEKIGLINRVCGHEDLDRELDKLTNKLCSKSSIVLQLARKAIFRTKDMDLEKAMDWSGDIYKGELMHTEDALHGIEAFQTQKKPVWKNR
jgi:cyclohexa-1,5-dienecarbonyl-CoA hydratase